MDDDNFMMNINMNEIINQKKNLNIDKKKIKKEKYLEKKLFLKQQKKK